MFVTCGRLYTDIFAAIPAENQPFRLKMCSKFSKFNQKFKIFYAKLTGFGEMERYLMLEFRIIAFQLYTCDAQETHSICVC